MKYYRAEYINGDSINFKSSTNNAIDKAWKICKQSALSKVWEVNIEGKRK